MSPRRSGEEQGEAELALRSPRLFPSPEPKGPAFPRSRRMPVLRRRFGERQKQTGVSN